MTEAHWMMGTWQEVPISTGKPRLRWLSLAEEMRRSMARLKRPSPDERRGMEKTFRTGYTHGYLHALDDMRRLTERGYTRSREVWNFMVGQSEALYRWRRSDCATLVLAPGMKFPPRWKDLCAAVMARDRCCILCGSSELLEFDHEPEIQDGGMASLATVRVLCRPCHERKTREAAEARRHR